MPTRPFRALAAAALSALLALAPASAHWWGPKTPPGRPGFPAQIPPSETGYTLKTYADAMNAAIAAVFNEEWGVLDRMHDEFLASRQRTTHGLWMLEALQGAWDAQLDVEDTTDMDRWLGKWQAGAPDSRMRKLVMAIRWQRQAWVARGGGSASSVPGEGMRLFRERLAKAAAALDEAGPAGRESPLWYWVALIVAGSSQQPASAMDALYEEAAGKFPTYHTIHYTRLNYLLPQWGGSFEAVDRFVGRVVERTRATDGEAFYAWLYMDVADKTEGDLFTETAARWPRMKKAFQDMLARYPDDFNRNRFATFACRARDRETTAALLQELGPRASLGYASPGYTTESCRRFAFSKA